LTFAAEKPPPAHAFEQVALMAAEGSGGYESRWFKRDEESAVARLTCPRSIYYP